MMPVLGLTLVRTMHSRILESYRLLRFPCLQNPENILPGVCIQAQCFCRGCGCFAKNRGEYANLGCVFALFADSGLACCNNGAGILIFLVFLTAGTRFCAVLADDEAALFCRMVLPTGNNLLQIWAIRRIMSGFCVAVRCRVNDVSRWFYIRFTHPAS